MVEHGPCSSCSLEKRVDCCSDVTLVVHKDQVERDFPNAVVKNMGLGALVLIHMVVCDQLDVDKGLCRFITEERDGRPRDCEMYPRDASGDPLTDSICPNIIKFDSLVVNEIEVVAGSGEFVCR